MLFQWLFFKSKFLRSRWSRQIALSETETVRARDQDFQDRDETRDQQKRVSRPGLKTSITAFWRHLLATKHFSFLSILCLYKCMWLATTKSFCSHYSSSRCCCYITKTWYSSHMAWSERDLSHWINHALWTQHRGGTPTEKWSLLLHCFGHQQHWMELFPTCSWNWFPWTDHQRKQT